LHDIAPLLDGTRSVDDVAGGLPAYAAESVRAFLELLASHGITEYVTSGGEAGAAPTSRADSFLGQWSDDAAGAIRRLRGARVLVVGLEPWGAVAAMALSRSWVAQLDVLDDRVVEDDDVVAGGPFTREDVKRPRTEALVEALSDNHAGSRVSIRRGGPRTDGLSLNTGEYDLVIVALPSDHLADFYALGAESHRAGLVSLACTLDGVEAVLGPAVAPHETPCWNCARLRQVGAAQDARKAHAIQKALLESELARRRSTTLPAMGTTLGHLAALEAIKILSGYTPSRLFGHVFVQNLVTLESSYHKIIRMPWCGLCGGASQVNHFSDKASEPLDEAGSFSPGPLDEVTDPKGLREALAGWVDSRTGVIKSLWPADLGADEPLLPRIASAALSSYADDREVFPEAEIGSGKGLTTTDAMLGAVGEAIERYSAARYRRHELLRTSRRALDGEAISPGDLALYAQEQYQNPAFPYARVDDDTPLEWARGEWLATGAQVWVPALVTYFNYRVPPGEYFCQVSSNGLAAGSDLTRASYRAVLELVERDAFMLSWLARRRPRYRLSLDGSMDIGVHEVVREISQCGGAIEAYVLDVTPEVPTVACLAFGDGQRWPAVTASLASDLSVRVAATKAILEQGHVGPYIRRLYRRGESAIPAGPEGVRTLIDHALYYAPTDRGAFDFLRVAPRDAVAVGDLDDGSERSLGMLRERLQQARLPVAMVDVTSPDVRLSPFRVVRAVGPNIQQIDFGFASRRLGNPRLHALVSQPINSHPHPIA
jgi:ribosomal protein S12 methylthiotransferase accessory factor